MKNKAGRVMMIFVVNDDLERRTLKHDLVREILVLNLRYIVHPNQMNNEAARAITDR